MQTTVGFRRANVLVISIAHFIHDLYTAFLAQSLPLIIQKLSISTTKAGLLSVFQLLPNYFTFMVGLYGGNVKAKYFVMFAPSVTTISMSLIGVAPGYTMLAVLLFISGLGSTLFHAPTPVLVKKFSGNRIGMGMSLYMLGGEIGRTLGPLVIVGVVSLWGFEGTYRLIPFGILASLLLYLRLRKTDISEPVRHDNRPVDYRGLFKRFLPLLLVITGFTVAGAFMKSALTYYLPTYITAKTGMYEFSGISLSVLQMVGAIGTLNAGTISDKIGRKTTLLIISIAAPLFMWVFLFTEGWSTIPVLIVLGFFLVAPTPVVLAIITEYETDHLVFINSVYLTMIFLTQSLGALLVGLSSDIFGLETTFRISAVIALLAIVFVLMLPGSIRVKRESA